MCCDLNWMGTKWQEIWISSKIFWSLGKKLLSCILHVSAIFFGHFTGPDSVNFFGYLNNSRVHWSNANNLRMKNLLLRRNFSFQMSPRSLPERMVLKTEMIRPKKPHGATQVKQSIKMCTNSLQNAVLIHSVAAR